MSYLEAVHRVEANYEFALDSKTVTPLSLASGSTNFIILGGWILISHSVPISTSKWARLLVFASIAYTSSWSLLYCRSIGVVGSIGVGLNSVLCTILAINFLLLHDPKTFKRLTIQPADTSQHKGNWYYHNERLGRVTLQWEPMPKSVWRRVVWTLDLLTSVRGVQWCSSISSWTETLSDDLLPDRTNSLPRNFLRFILDYLLIDLIKCVMIADPYFIGFSTFKPPPHIALYITSPLALYTYRMLLAATGIWVAIDFIFSFTALLQVNILGPSLIGLNGSSAMFPPLWGSPRAILNKGLRGFWGETWHQMLRMHFVSIGDAIAGSVLRARVGIYRPNKVDNKDTSPKYVAVARTIRVTTAFLLSGLLHACASFTLLGPTRPWAPFLFFALQPVGIGIQMMLSQFCFKLYVYKLPKGLYTALCQCSNLGFTLLWLWTCCGLLADDMSNGGMWLFEPVPVSLIRGFGYSKEDNRFWCW